MERGVGTNELHEHVPSHNKGKCSVTSQRIAGLCPWIVRAYSWVDCFLETLTRRSTKSTYYSKTCPYKYIYTGGFSLPESRAWIKLNHFKHKQPLSGACLLSAQPSPTLQQTGIQRGFNQGKLIKLQVCAVSRENIKIATYSSCQSRWLF